MCKTRRATRLSDPKTNSKVLTRSNSRRVPVSSSSSIPFTTADLTSSSFSSSFSLAAGVVPRGPTLFPFLELLSATDQFLSSSSSSSWRCSLRGADAVVSRRRFLADPSSLPSRLADLSRFHHAAVAPLLGASLGADHLFLVHQFVPGPSLSSCLRPNPKSPRNPRFTPLSSWLSRLIVADDIAHGFQYIHQGSVHGRIKSSSVIVTEPGCRAVICHLGSAELAGEGEEGRIEGTRGYMAPEILAGGRISRSADVYAFGVVLLELISGAEPVSYLFNEESGDWERRSVIETARGTIGEGDGEKRVMRIRQWVDGRLRDSFPVEEAEKLIRVALRCVEAEEEKRPDMVWVAGKISKLLIDANKWDETFQRPTEAISLSVAPR
ncbi:lysM domain receptor-like kinase 3 [Typha latifolia]|uniref:lysM domain receptor-like kinase 3 n=1 Tax=Typha latifolia TaxID=4733 RepID=UPI003C2CD9B1